MIRKVLALISASWLLMAAIPASSYAQTPRTIPSLERIFLCQEESIIKEKSGEMFIDHQIPASIQSSHPRNGPLKAKFERPSSWKFWKPKILKIYIENLGSHYVYIPHKEASDIKINGVTYDEDKEINSYYIDHDRMIIITAKDIYKTAKPAIAVIELVVSPPHSIKELAIKTVAPVVVESATGIDAFELFIDSIGFMINCDNDKGTATMIFRNALLFNVDRYNYTSEEISNGCSYAPGERYDHSESHFPHPIWHYKWSESRMYEDLKHYGVHIDPWTYNSEGFINYGEMYGLPKDSSIKYFILAPRTSLVFEIPYDDLDEDEFSLGIKEYQALETKSKHVFSKESWRMGTTIAYIKCEHTLDGYSIQPFPYYSLEASFSTSPASHWYTPLLNVFDEIKNFFTETVPTFFRNSPPSDEESVEEEAKRKVKKDLDMLSSSLNFISELQKSFYESSEEEISDEYLQFEFKYTIQGAKFLQDMNDAKSYMNAMDIGSYDINDAISTVTEFGLEQSGFCIVIVDFYVNIAGDVEERRYPVVCDEKGNPFWENWHLYEYIEEIYEETKQEHYGAEHYEAEQLVLENQELKGTRLKICIRNPGISDAIIIAIYRDGTFVATVNKVLPRNSITCFDLPGTYYLGNEVTLVTEEGTQIKFKVK